MTKQPEEGEIWEWRAFGEISDALVERVRAHPIRMGIEDAPGEDIYLISALSDQNVKLRKWGDEWVLKFKLMLKRGPRGAQLYSESASMIFRFPVGDDIAAMAAKLLSVRLPDQNVVKPTFDKDEFTAVFEQASPAASIIKVSKVRSQFDIAGGWVELADMTFPCAQSQSISIHSADVESVLAILDELNPEADLEIINYVEACRRWGVRGE